MEKAMPAILVIVVALLFLALRNADELPWVPPIPGPAPAPAPKVVIPEACRPAIEAIQAMTIEDKDAVELSRYFIAFAKTIETDGSLIDSCESLQLINSWSGKMFLIEQNLYGKYMGLSAHVDDAIAASMGSKRRNDGFERVTIDDAKKHNLAQALRAIAWAVQQ